MGNAQFSSEQELIAAIQDAIDAAHDEGMGEVAQDLTAILNEVHATVGEGGSNLMNLGQAAD